MHDIIYIGHFIWSESHGDVMYENFGEGEPNNFYGDEDCVLKSREYWNDDNCYKNAEYEEGRNIHALCEAPLSSLA